MIKLFKIALRNLIRFKRRTLLTTSLIAIGVLFVMVFIAASSSFNNIIIGQITDSMLGHIQVHKRGYMASIDSLPLTLNLSEKGWKKFQSIAEKIPEIESISPRIKFGGMFSNYMDSTNIRINGVYPDMEIATIPLLLARVKGGEKTIKKGEILIPELLATGLKVKAGDSVVVIATNKDGSVNGKQFRVSGIIESVTGPGGRDGYIHIEDARDILRMEELEVSEVAIRINDFSKLNKINDKLTEELSGSKNKQGKQAFDVRTWEKLSPFYNISKMIDIMTIFIKIMLIAIVLVSIMNVMIMAVYERIREIGTISALGTMPEKILALFLIEGFSLGVAGVIVGNLLAGFSIFLMNVIEITFNFSRQTGYVLSPELKAGDIIFVSVVVIVMSVFATLQPAIKAAKMEPVDALRHV
ncbi:MAG: ABC transporter permease [Candidatus Aminicenantes bacterium]|nr:ABC transporter permease [Candidatus Aminicenantes bacterium]